jgi:hypothetical protein
MLIVEGDGRIRALNGAEPDASRAGSPTEARVFISDAALRWLALPWNEDLLQPRSALSQLDLHAELMFGKEPEGLVYARAHAPFGQPQCAAGAPKRLVEAIHAFARGRNLTVTLLQPLAWACWERCRKDIAEKNYLFAVIERAAVTALVVSHKRVERVVARACVDNPVATLEAMWHRMQLREPALADITARYAFDATGETSEEAAASGFTLLGAMANDHAVAADRASGEPAHASSADSASGEPAHALNADSASGEPVCALLASRSATRGTVDFIVGPPPMTGWRSALLAAGIACLAVFGARAGLAYSERASRQADLDSVSSERAPQPAGGQQRTRAQIRSVNQAITALNLPVGSLLKSIQPPRELHTALLGLDLSDIRSDTHTATVKITAESRTGADMTAYVDRLSRSRMFDSVFLTRHEIVDARGTEGHGVDSRSVDAGGEHPYRYEVQAAWRQ